LAEAVRDNRRDAGAAIEQIEAYLQKFKGWAECCPENFLAKQTLLEAELAYLKGEDKTILLDAYDTAISTATQTGRVIEQALACERAASYWQRSGKTQLSGFYLQQAMEGYLTWGSEAKVAQLQRDHASLLRSRLEEGARTSISSSSGEELHQADFHSILKAAQTIAAELVIDRMLARLINLVVETACAQTGYLLLEQEDDWCVVAEQHPDSVQARVLQWQPLAHTPEIAASVVHYVARSQKIVNLNDAMKSTLFSADSSISGRQCRSVLCLPIMNRGDLSGILYLENNLSTNAFTRTQTRILQLLMTQAISSLEISRYYAQVQDLNQNLEAEIEEHKRTELKLEFLANHDALTNLPNRRLFYDRVTHAIQRVQRKDQRIAVLFLDLDQFKNVNDTLSHQVGDLLLQQVAKRLVAQVREGDTLGRLGGDEFVLLIEGDFEPTLLTKLAEKILAVFHRPIQVDNHELFLTGSIGISLYPDDATDTDTLLRNADAAMYQAKQSGRDTYQFFSSELAKAAIDRVALEHDLRRAIEREEFELYYQPQVLLESRAIIGAEVLLRWHHPERGLLGPIHFIPLAENSEAIVAIGEWVLRAACEQLQTWHRAGISINRLALNVSGRQIDPQGRFAKLVKETLKRTAIDPAQLELELTESVILQETTSAEDSLEQLSNLGLQLAIDDFGTGYSSLISTAYPLSV
jgi:diguanylate cyclase (GGDEF)-like protein